MIGQSRIRVKTVCFATMLSLLVCPGLLRSRATPKRKFSLAGKSVYFVMVDRFAHPDEAAGECKDDEWCGGTIAALIKRLDYIYDMGFDCIWVTPVVEQIKGTSCIGSWCGTGYHGYWAQNFFHIDPRFGSTEDMKALSQGIHLRGMRLMYDIVINHVRPVHSSRDLATIVPFNEPAHFNLLGKLTSESFDDYLHQPGVPPNAISTFGCCGCSAGDMLCSGAEGYNETIVERGWFWDLADLNHSNAFVTLALGRWIGEMVTNYSIDALRLDTAPYVPRDFLRKFRQSAGIEIFGEVTTSNYSFLASYQNVLGGVFNFKLGHAIREAFCPSREVAFEGQRFASNSSNFSGGSSFSRDGAGPVVLGSVRRVVTVLDEMTLAASTGMLTPELMVNLVDSHDMSRVGHKCGGDLVRVSNAVALTMLLPGIPVIMYGTEWGFAYDQSHTRASLWTSRFNATAAPLYEFTSRLNALRRQGDYRWTSLRITYADDSSLVLRQGSKLNDLWLFVSTQPASYMSQPRRYCASGLQLASQSSEWTEVLYGHAEDGRADFDIHGCYMARDGWPKVLLRKRGNSQFYAVTRNPFVTS